MPLHEVGLAGDHAASAPAAAPGLSERAAPLLLTYTPLGLLVRAVARLRLSVHFKLLAAFLLVALLVAAMGAMSLETISTMSKQSETMHHAHQRVTSARQAQHALAMQMNYTAMALILRDAATIGRILRGNNSLNSRQGRDNTDAPRE